MHIFLPSPQLLSADTYASYSQGVTAAAARDVPAFDASLYIFLYLSMSIRIHIYIHIPALILAGA